MIVAIVLMAGAGQRLGGAVKSHLLLEGRPVYEHTLQQLKEGWPFDAIVLVMKQPHPVEGCIVVQGGASRRQSCYQGLLACPEGTETVVIHDAVRPFVTPRIVAENVRMAQVHKAVNTCIPSSDTLVHHDGEQIHTIPDRSTLWRGQTPQSFDYQLIRKAHETVPELVEHVDDCRLVLELGVKPYIVQGEESNFKITTEFDWEWAQSYARRRSAL